MRNIAKMGMGALALLLMSAPSSSAETTGAGGILWQHQLGGELWSPMSYADGALYLGSDDGGFYAFDVARREVKWRFETGGIIRSGAALSGDNLLFASDDGFLYCLSRNSGQLQWRFDLESAEVPRFLPSPEPPYGYDFMHSTPVVADGVVFVGSANHALFAVDATTGQQVWRFDTQGMIRSTPLVANGRVYVGSWDGYAYAVNTRSGELAWKFDTGQTIQSSPALGDGRIYISSRSARMFALEPETGELLWTYSHTNGSWVESSAVFANGMVYVGSSDAGKLLAHDASTGKVIWSFDTMGWSWGMPTVTEETVYIGGIKAPLYYEGMRSGLYAVDRVTGEERWQFRPEDTAGFIEGGVYSRAVVVDGVVYVAALDGSLYALAGADRATAIEGLQGHLSPSSTPGAAVAPRAVPNPFNPQTSIHYHLERDHKVELAVFDITGRRVDHQSLGWLPAGNHRVAWDGHDDSGSPVATGTYLYALSAEGWIQSGKMMLLR